MFSGAPFRTANRPADRTRRAVAVALMADRPARSPQTAHRNATGGAARSGRTRTRPAHGNATAGGCRPVSGDVPEPSGGRSGGAPCPARSPQGEPLPDRSPARLRPSPSGAPFRTANRPADRARRAVAVALMADRPAADRNGAQAGWFCGWWLCGFRWYLLRPYHRKERESIDKRTRGGECPANPPANRKRARLLVIGANMRRNSPHTAGYWERGGRLWYNNGPNED